MPQRDTGDFTGFACDTCLQKFDQDHELIAHKKAVHAEAKASGAQSSHQGSDPHTNPADKKPGVEPADHQKTTELPPGAEKARAGRN